MSFLRTASQYLNVRHSFFILIIDIVFGYSLRTNLFYCMLYNIQKKCHFSVRREALQNLAFSRHHATRLMQCECFSEISWITSVLWCDDHIYNSLDDKVQQYKLLVSLCDEYFYMYVKTYCMKVGYGVALRTSDFAFWSPTQCVFFNVNDFLNYFF